MINTSTNKPGIKRPLGALISTLMATVPGFVAGICLLTRKDEICLHYHSDIYVTVLVFIHIQSMQSVFKIDFKIHINKCIMQMNRDISGII